MDALTVNGTRFDVHSIGTEEFTFESRDDVIGSLTKVVQLQVQITFPPKLRKHWNTKSVNVGNNIYSNSSSSVSYDA